MRGTGNLEGLGATNTLDIRLDQRRAVGPNCFVWVRGQQALAGDSLSLPRVTVIAHWLTGSIFPSEGGGLIQYSIPRPKD